MGKRITGAVVVAGAFLMWSAATALAQTSTSYPPSPKPTTSVEAAGGGNEPTAFTGGRIGFAVLAIAILLVVGIVASVIARRRSASVGG